MDGPDADVDDVGESTGRLVDDARTEEQARVATAWLSVVDSLDRALAHADVLGGPIVDDVRAVRDEAVALLAAMGYPRHDETGVAFDPLTHKAVGVRPAADAPAGTVVEVVRPGYGDRDGQLRPADVVVAGEAE
jgi:molecular chaperone GrpE